MNLQAPLYHLREHPNRLSVSRWKEQALYLHIAQDVYSGYMSKEQLECSLQRDQKYLYSLLSPKLKKHYHLYLSRRYFESADYPHGLLDLIRLAKLDPSEFALNLANKILRSKNLRFK